MVLVVCVKFSLRFGQRLVNELLLLYNYIYNYNIFVRIIIYKVMICRSGSAVVNWATTSLSKVLPMSSVRRNKFSDVKHDKMSRPWEFNSLVMGVNIFNLASLTRDVKKCKSSKHICWPEDAGTPFKVMASDFKCVRHDNRLRPQSCCGAVNVKCSRPVSRVNSISAAGLLYLPNNFRVRSCVASEIARATYALR